MVLVNDEVNTSSTEDEEINNASQHENKGRRKCSNIRNNDEGTDQPHNSNTTSSNSNSQDYQEIVINMFIDASKKLGQQMKRTIHYVMNDLGGYQMLDRCAQWCVQHPQLAICILAAGIVTSLPILLFVAFAVSTIVMTFTGFLVLEGTLLTILAMIMFGLLGAVAIVFIFFALVGVATYMGVSHVYDMYGCTETQRTNLRIFMQRNDLKNLHTQKEPEKNLNETSGDENVSDSKN